MFKKRFTVLIVPHSEKETRAISVPVFLMKILIVLGIISFFSIVYFWAQYFKYRTDAMLVDRYSGKNAILEKKLQEMSRESKNLEQKIREIEEFKAQIIEKNRLGQLKKGNAKTKTPSRGGYERTLAVGRSPDDNLDLEDNDYPAFEEDGTAEDLDRLEEFLSSASGRLEQLKKELALESESLAVTPSIWPTSGRLTSKFGYRRDPYSRKKKRIAFHEGIDIANSKGTPVYATANGIVRYAGWEKGYGKTILISHGNGIATKYGHLTKIIIKEGDRVSKGQLIAKMGSTGRSTGSHLHYEIWEKGKPVDPLKYLE